jgi:homoserine kinase
MTRYYAPASTGNFSVGFDLLGLALEPLSGELLGDVLEIIGESQAFSLTQSGRYVHQLPSNLDENLVRICFRTFEQKIAKPLPNVAVHLQKNLPVGSGLGSSACSIAVACYAFNEYFKRPLNTQQLLQLMAECEGGVSGSVHYDNVAPSLLGGLQLMLPGSTHICRSLPWFAHWRVVVCYPGTVISTKAAREVLPEAVPRATTIEFSGLLARFVSALYAQDEADALASVQDVLAEPHRLALIPELIPLREKMREQGIAHLGISGSGPTLFALCNTDEQADIAATLFRSHYEKNADAMTHICRMAERGARQL